MYEVKTHNFSHIPYLLVINGVVMGVNQPFLHFTGYSKAEIINNTLSDVTRKLLKISEDLSDLENLQNSKGIFLFTKSSSAKEVSVKVCMGNNHNTILYTFEERPDSFTDEKFPYLSQLCEENFKGVAIYCIPDSILVKANQCYASFLDEPGTKVEDIIGKRIDDIFEGWKGSPSESIWRNIIKTGKSFYASEYMYDGFKRGRTYWDCTITPVCHHGKVKYLVVVSSDVTEYVQQKIYIKEQTKLIEQQSRNLEAVIENLSDAVFVFDSAGNYILANKPGREYFPSFKLNKAGDAYALARYFDSNSNEIPFKDMPISQLLKGKSIENVRMTMEHAGIRRHISVSGTPVTNHKGDIELAVLCSRDVTEYVEHEKMLKKQLDYLYKLINTFDLPIVRISYPKLELIEFNKKAYTELYKLTDIVAQYELNPNKTSQKIVDIFPHFKSDDNHLYVCEAAETKVPVYRKNYSIIKSDHKRHINTIYQPILNSKDEVVEFLIISVDVTSEIKEKEALERLLKMKDEFLSLISHEFKTPLTVINSAIQAMELICKNELTDKSRSFLSKIKQNSFRQLRLVNNLLDITRANAGRIKIHNRNLDIVMAARAITESVRLYADQKGVNLAFYSTLSKKTIGIDDEKFERILLNLLSNAIKFTPKGKSISVRVSQKARMVCLEVADEGVGIPKDKQGLIFERFGQVDSSLTRQAEGTGIGLSLVKLLVNALGGKISVNSKVGKGTTFTVLLPSEKIKETNIEKTIEEITDNRLVQMVAVEFSDIYL